jgi:hypothetical protein
MPEWFEKVTTGDRLDRQGQRFGERVGVGISLEGPATDFAILARSLASTVMDPLSSRRQFVPP